MSLSPLEIHEWAIKYQISPSWLWEVIEVCTDDLSDVEDTVWLMDNIASYIESVDLEPFHDPASHTFQRLRYFYLHTLPVIAALCPYMDERQRGKIHHMSRNLSVTSAVDACMYPETR